MTRALTILTAVVALAVTAAPASAGSSKKPPPRGLSIATSEVFELNIATKRPRAISTRSGGEVVSFFERSNAPFTVDMATEKLTAKTKSRLKAAPKPINPKPLSLNTNSGDDT